MEFMTLDAVSISQFITEQQEAWTDGSKSLLKASH
jgi:hypothetical protein